MASKARDFMAWTEGFYAKHETRMADAVAAVGGEAWMATEYIEHSKAQIQDVFTTGGTAEDFAAITAAWLTRADELAATITGAGK